MKILIPLDGTAESETILPWVEPFLGLPEARGEILHVSPTRGEEDEGHAKDCQGYVDSMRGRLKAWGDRLDARVEWGDPAMVILRRSRELKADLLAMRTRSRQGVPRLALGSVTAEVLEETSAPLLLAGPGLRKPRETPAVRSVLVPLDGSDWSAQILEDVRILAGAFGARATLLHVGKAEPRMAAWAADLSQKGVPCATAELPGHPATGILAQASLGGFDLVAMATHGRSGFRRLVLGSVAEEVVRASPVPVLVRRPG